MILEILWSVIAFIGLMRAITLWREALLDKHALSPREKNGRRILAKWQLEHAALGIAVYVLLFSAGFVALLYRYEAVGLQVRLAVSAGGACLALLVLVIRQERDAYFRRKHLGLPPPHERIIAGIRSFIRWLNSSVRRSR